MRSLLLFALLSGANAYWSAVMTPLMVKWAAHRVMRDLGVGHTESVYQSAMITYFTKRGFNPRAEVICPIMFMGECVGFGRADIVVDQYVIELKANEADVKQALPQLRKYVVSLRDTEKKSYEGLAVNFNQRSALVDIGELPSIDKKESMKDLEVLRYDVP